ncbi:iron-sulfur cluster assembly accessory protein [Thalassobaculum sp.]|uniref:HesB/IscA family protein n=1 Tax=Thalassobaculum sp. TaxID=2022740 RepID=UPI0032ED31E3
MFQPMKAPITLTEAAAARVRDLMAKSPEDGVIGLRVGVKNTGCSGLSYVIEYAKERKKFEDLVEDKGVSILIDPTAVMFILGSEMDYKEDKLFSGFVFNNPNETGRCGCGESFSVAAAKS